MVKRIKFPKTADNDAPVIHRPNANKCSIAYHRIMSRRDAILVEAVAALAEYGVRVRSELDDIALVPHRLRSRSAAAFAILSPQAAFKLNVRAILPLLASLDNGDDVIAVHDAVRASGYTMTNHKKAIQYVQSRDIITNASYDQVTFDYVRSCAGFGHKTASMYVALYNRHARVMTLDTWMYSGMAGMLNGTSKNDTTYSANDAAYADIRDMLLSIADELNVPPFDLQFAMWCYYQNKWISHLAIFGLAPLED